MRTNARKDANHDEIVKELREAGASVSTLHQLGQGVPDLLVGARKPCPSCHSLLCYNALIEIKTLYADLTPDECKWHASWRGQVAVARTVAEALRIAGIE